VRRRRGPYAPDLERNRLNALAVRRVGRPVLIQPSTPPALGADHGQYVSLPGFNFPPAGCIPVDVIGDANLAPSASGVLITVTVPDTFRLRVAGIGFGADDDIALGYLSWAIRLGPDQVQGYGNVLAAIGSIRQLAEIVVLAAASQTLTVVATIAATAPITYRYIARLRGWFYSEKEQH
jgi:hypothetical protein